MSRGVIYILTNPSFPDYVKIGYAKDIKKRLKQLNRSETIPFAFRAYAVYETDTSLTDKQLHKLIDNLNPDLRTIETFDGKERVKEFYAMSAEDAYSLLECIARISGTQEKLKRVAPEGNEIQELKMAEEISANARRGPLRFSDIGIKPGSKIEFVKDPSIKATVVDDRHIEFNGQTTSLTALAKELLGEERTGHIPGPLFFSYKGEVLAYRRKRIEGRD